MMIRLKQEKLCQYYRVRPCEIEYMKRPGGLPGGELHVPASLSPGNFDSGLQYKRYIARQMKYAAITNNARSNCWKRVNEGRSEPAIPVQVKQENGRDAYPNLRVRT